MPVTAKLSRKFYERLGDDIADELVDWFNAVDATYKADLKATNDLNWERFKTTLSGEMSSLEGKLRGEISSLEGKLLGEISSLPLGARAPSPAPPQRLPRARER